MKKFVASAAVVAACALYAGTANAISVSIISQDASDFSVLPADVFQTAPTFTNPTVIVNQTGSVAGQWRSPFENAASGFGAVQNLTNGGWVLPGAYDLNYITIQAGGSATYDFSANSVLPNQLTLLWGSPDDYNSILFCTGISGAGVVSGCSAPFTGSSPPGAIETFGHNQITLGTDVPFVAVQLLTGQNAFEYANLFATCTGPGCGEITPEVPLPGALPLFVSALACGGLLLRRRKRNQAS
jgi:hypothetical protein